LNANQSHDDTLDPNAIPPLIGATGDSPAWEQIDIGRFQPRRIRGSLRGRELG